MDGVPAFLVDEPATLEPCEGGLLVSIKCGDQVYRFFFTRTAYFATRRRSEHVAETLEAGAEIVPFKR